MTARKYGNWSSKMDFPYLHDAIFLDIETDMEMNRVWLIGVKLKDNEEQFLAWNWLEEASILQDFTQFLAEHPAKPLICYSTTNFDFRVLQAAALRLGLDQLQEQMSQRALIDMGTLLRRHYSPYGKSYSLKMLRFLIGYQYDDLAMNGEEVAIRYYQQVKGLGKITKQFAKKALAYNLDDIRILHEMIHKFEDQITYTSNYTRTMNLVELKELVEENMYSSTINNRFIRFSFYKDQASQLMQYLMQHGLPLPEVKEGINVTALYWRSQFSYHQMAQLVDNLDLNI